MKILVTGGTGLVGAHLLYSLTKNGAYPIAIKRATSNIQNVKKIFSYYSDDSETLFQQIQWKECDVLDIVKLDLIYGLILVLQIDKLPVIQILTHQFGPKFHHVLAKLFLYFLILLFF